MDGRPARAGYRFNSRSREGSDLRSGAMQGFMPVSIHAPARGATKLECQTRGLHTRFNSRSREGSDPEGIVDIETGKGFQFTLPRGERRYRD